MKLTDRQREMLEKAANDPNGQATAGLGPRQRTAYKLAELGLGATRFYGQLIFCINDAGRAEVNVPRPITERPDVETIERMRRELSA